jgi:recombinational DNA repair protein RecR
MIRGDDVYDSDKDNDNKNYLLLQSALQPLDGFRPAQLSLSILSRKVLQSAVASGTSNPQLGREPGI